MTVPSFKAFGAQAMEFLFGRRLTAAELAVADAARPPEHLQIPFRVIRWITSISVTLALLWTFGWLPFVNSTLDRNWFWLVFAIDVLQRFAWEQITKHYRRQTEDRMTPTP